MMIHLPPHIESSIQAAVHSCRFASLDEAMAEAATLLVQWLNHEQAQTKPAAASQADAGHADKPIWEVIAEENRLIPPEVWAALPADLSEQPDHYICGTPKRPAQ
jgi:Arc/MetJ-type ribon-helix-helix transcriptional regulator